MKRLFEDLQIFLIGAVLYSGIETLVRGYTHWSMTLAGGICLVLLYQVFTRLTETAWWKKCLLGAFIITCIELTVGCIVNLWLGWGVWNYSGHRFHYLGQISLLFTVFWFFLSLPVVWLAKPLKKMTERDVV